MKLDSVQEQIVNSNSSKIIVNAGAGSGKTRVLVERIRRLLNEGVEPSSIVAITFTNMAADEMKERFQDIERANEMFVGTIHKLANVILNESDEDYKILSSDLEDWYMKGLLKKYGTVLDFKKYKKYKEIKQKEDAGLKVKYRSIDILSYDEYQEYWSLYRNLPTEKYPETLYTMIKRDNAITFDELIRKATEYFEEKGKGIEYLFVDEFQDIGTLEWNFFQSLNANNCFYIGDDWQCQPSGTKVTMEDGSLKNIEDLKVGDRVLSYNVKEGYYNRLSKKSKGKEIESISVHNAEDLVTIVTETGKESSYTKNHRCFARIHYEGNENKSVVYIMENEKGQFRVGSTKLFTENGRNFGLRNRMNTEKGIHGWILDVFDTEKEAWLCEQICSYKFGIPQVTWTYKNIKSTEKEIDSLYCHLDDLRNCVSECLNMYGRDINYPIFEKDINKHFSKIHITEVHACNLIAKVMDVATPYYDLELQKYRHDFEQISTKLIINNQYHKVYGLKIKDNETYVADGILTHNSIYSFKGSCVDIFINLFNDPQWESFTMANNYRCGSEILKKANIVIEQDKGAIKKQTVAMSGIEGNVGLLNKSNTKLCDIVKRFVDEGEAKNTAILVRTNRDLQYILDLMYDNDIPCTTFKKGNLSKEEMDAMLKEDRVKLLTVHASKGLEFNNVLLYGNFPLYEPSFRCNPEERRVMYVGMTRAINNLYIFN